MEGRIALQVASGCSKKANSSSQMLADMPRTVSGLPGTAMQREPLPRVIAPALSSTLRKDTVSSENCTRSERIQSLTLPNDSNDWRSEGAAIIQVVFGVATKSSAMMAPVAKLLPVWRAHTPHRKRLLSCTHAR